MAYYSRWGSLPQPSIKSSVRGHFLLGIVACLGMFLSVGLWAVTVRIAGAVIAPGVMAVESSLKKVQHPTGGVVGELNVNDGSVVHAGDVLLRLDATTTRAKLNVVARKLDELDGRHARLAAERDSEGLVPIPASFRNRSTTEPHLREIMSDEQHLFTARLEALAGQKAQLNERIEQYTKEIEGLDAQILSADSQLDLVKKELKDLNELYVKRLVPASRWIALQREAVRLDGEKGRLLASIAESKGKIAETRLQIIQLDQNRRTEVVNELRDVDAQYGELVERNVAAADDLKRIDIRAPQDGIVHQLAVHTVGGVVGPGETLMYIVPTADVLTVEARVAPKDIDQVEVGQQAIVRLVAFNQRTTPELVGQITRVSADITEGKPAERTQQPYYEVRMELAASEIGRLGGLKLRPGMPAEIHIQTESRTALSYLIKPVADQIARAFREQ